MYSNPQKVTSNDVAELRHEAGRWLKQLREARGLSQRQLAAAVGVEYYTFISQLECGHGRIPPDRYRIWADALAVELRHFVRLLMQFYDPVTYQILFEGNQSRAPASEKVNNGRHKKPVPRAINSVAAVASAL